MKNVLIGTIAVLALVLAIGCGVIISQNDDDVPFGPKTGWVEQDDGRFYYIDGQPATGWQELEDGIYYFSPSGAPLIGWQDLSGKTLYLGTTGALYSGWLEENGSFFYLSDGEKQYGWLDLGHDRYYLDETGARLTGWQNLDGKALYFGATGVLHSGWLEENGSFFYLSNGEKQYGWLDLDADRYYLGETGARHTGWLTLDGSRYFFLEDGTMGRGQVFVEELDPRYFQADGKEIQLVNPWNAIPEDYTVELVNYSQRYQIAAECLEPLRQMLADCKAAGHTAIVTSAYRTQEYQQGLFDRKIQYYISRGYTREEAEVVAATVVAYPGTSEHQLGLAVDLVDITYQLLDEAQEQTAAQRWLMENSWRYGFTLRYPNGKSELTGIIYEPWHYRYVGIELARELYEKDLCLEEYLQALTGV